MASGRKKRLEIDMIAGSQLRDTQGEMLAIEGADISDLEFGRGRLNDNHGKGFFNSIGRVVEAKKIFKAEDCVNERHKYYWEKVKAPYIYVRGELYDDEDHPNAKAAAAILRNIHKADCPLKIKASVEGGVVARGIKDPSLLQQTKIHSVALTFTPANNATLVEPLNLDKGSFDEEEDKILIKSVIHLAKNDVPNFRMIQKAASAAKAARNIKKIQKLLQKAKQEAALDALVTESQKLGLYTEFEQQEDLDKGIKSAIAGAAMSAALGAASPKAEAKNAIMPTTTTTQIAMQTPNAQPEKKLTHQDVVNSLKDSDPHLWAFAQQESTGGTNLKHQTLKSGQHKGHTAGGPWGMMPKTVKYVLSISKDLAKKYPEIAEHAKDIKKNHKNITNALNENPQLAVDLAKALYKRIVKVHGSKNKDKILHSWHHGIVGTGKAIHAGKDISSDEYVQKINNHLDTLDPKPRALAGEVKKALTAGYGGAGAPTSMTGGGVFQSETLEDDGRHKFKHITCDHCGHEQIYAKHQVKCRDCGKSFGLNKLVKLMT